MLSTADDGGTPLISVRLAAAAGADVVDVTVMGIGPFPLLAWQIPRVLVDELLNGTGGEAAVIQCHAETLGVGIHYPPGHFGPVAETTTDPVS